jgi:hypothetical protein
VCRRERAISRRILFDTSYQFDAAVVVMVAKIILL